MREPPAASAPPPTSPQRVHPPAPILRLGRSHHWIGLILASTDVLVLGVCSVGAVLAWYLIDRRLDPLEYLALWPVIPAFVGVSAFMKLYPGVGHNPVDEFRRQAIAASLVFLGLGTATFMTKQGPEFSRAVFLIGWASSFAALPITRAAVRGLLARRAWFGYPALVFGDHDGAGAIVTQLRQNKELGIRPVAIVSDEPGEHTHTDLPVIPATRLVTVLRDAGKIPYAFVSMRSYAQPRLGELLAGPLQDFRHTIVMPELPISATLWLTSVDLGGVLGLEVEHRLLDPGRRVLKRVLDLAALVVLLPMVLPLVGILAVAIKLDSPGPVLVRLSRVGEHGRIFKQLKFRSMVRNADEVLRGHLDRDPALRAEWERDHKLRDDPRMTRVGRLLRRTSIDELPQVFNVLGGSMSLVGPRPITTGETARYGDAVGLYGRVRPGLTGLWQVSGRNELVYAQRVQLDAYYARNWSVWLDLYILSKTVWVVLTGRGAY